VATLDLDEGSSYSYLPAFVGATSFIITRYSLFYPSIAMRMNRRNLLKMTAMTAGIAGLPLSLALMPGCKPAATPGWKSTIFNDEEALMIETLADIILPAGTDSPAASAVGVPAFIERIVRGCLSPADQGRFRRGMMDLEDDFRLKTGQRWLDVRREDQVRYISILDQQAFTGQESEIIHAYRQLKEWTLRGYYTSEPVMNQQLDYHAIPGEYRGCIEMTPETKAYVDNNVTG